MKFHTNMIKVNMLGIALVISQMMIRTTGSNTGTVNGEEIIQSGPPPVVVNTYNNGNCGGPASENNLQMERRVAALEHKMMNCQHTDDMTETSVKDCSDVFNLGNRSSGVYMIRPMNSKPFKVYCDFDDMGHWTVIQRRVNGDTDFDRSWLEYKHGFGHLDHNMWLGNDNIAAIVNQRQYKLRVDITDWDGVTKNAEYRFFRIEKEDRNYTIYYRNYTGTAGDAFNQYHYGQQFSTFDRDNDKKSTEDCASLHGGGWWYNECDKVNLNGRYNYDAQINGPVDMGLEWNAWKTYYSFKGSLMKIKRAFDD